VVARGEGTDDVAGELVGRDIEVLQRQAIAERGDSHRKIVGGEVQVLQSLATGKRCYIAGELVSLQRQPLQTTATRGKEPGDNGCAGELVEREIKNPEIQLGRVFRRRRRTVLEEIAGEVEGFQAGARTTQVGEVGK
jgi:hypothetical protein